MIIVLWVLLFLVYGESYRQCMEYDMEQVKQWCIDAHHIRKTKSQITLIIRSNNHITIHLNINGKQYAVDNGQININIGMLGADVDEIVVRVEAETSGTVWAALEVMDREIKTLPIPHTQLITTSQLGQSMLKLRVNDTYHIRITRKQGFPYIYLMYCHQPYCFKAQPQAATQLLQVYSEEDRWGAMMENSVWKVEGMINHMEEYEGHVCAGCTVYLFVDAPFSHAQVQVTLQEVASNMPLEQNIALRQTLPTSKTKHYLVADEQQQPIHISIQLLQGHIALSLTHNKQTKQYEATEHDQMITITIQPTSSPLALDIVADDDSTYWIWYSVGERQLYLQDGQTLSSEIEPNKAVSFLYNNVEEGPSPLYLSVTVHNPTIFNYLQLQLLYYDEEGKQWMPMKVNAQLPTVDTHRIPTSLIYELPPSYKLIKMTLLTSTGECSKLTLTINHQEVIFLPFNHSLPLNIDQGEDVSLLVDNNDEGYVQLTIKRCADSSPLVGYSTNSKDFLAHNYQYESSLGGDNDRVFKTAVKVEKGGNLFIRIMGDPLTHGFVEIMAKYLQANRNKLQEISQARLGRHGKLNYQLLTTAKAQITFTGLICDQGCRSDVVYECFASSSIDDLYRSMICPYSYLMNVINAPKPTTTVERINIKPAHGDNKISFKHLLEEPIMYVGVRATHSITAQELYYKPIEIATLWGQLHRMSSQFLALVVAVGLGIMGVVGILVRNQARQGYRPIKS